jgi:hypothetical protein
MAVRQFARPRRKDILPAHVKLPTLRTPAPVGLPARAGDLQPPPLLPRMLMKPRTLCFCRPVAYVMSSKVGPPFGPMSPNGAYADVGRNGLTSCFTPVLRGAPGRVGLTCIVSGECCRGRLHARLRILSSARDTLLILSGSFGSPPISGETKPLYPTFTRAAMTPGQSISPSPRLT